METPDPEPTAEPDKNLFTKGQMELLYKMFGKTLNLANTSISSSFFAQTSNTFLALNASCDSKPWIIDSRASNHMTSEQTFFHSYKSNSNSGKVIVVDGSFTPIIGKGSISVTSRLTLDSVLPVLKLSHNLLSISKPTKSLNCHMIFYPSHCIFQDLTTWKRIDRTEEKEGLYYLDSKTKENALGYVSKVSEEYEEQIWFLQYRLGHPSFLSLKTLYPDFFVNVDVSKFQCQVYELAKSHHVSFPLSNKRSEISFSTIHSDIWGPSRVNTYNGFKWFITFIDDFS